MLLLILFIFVFVDLIVLAETSYSRKVCIPIYIMALIIGMMSVAMVFTAVSNHKDSEDLYSELEDRHELLLWQIENEEVDYENIEEWNEDITRWKKLENNIWIGMIYPDIFDDFDLIEIEEDI